MKTSWLARIGLSVAMLPFLTSCAQVAELEGKFDRALYSAFYATVGKPLEYLEDSVRGYRVDYVTVPAGALLTCGGEDLGRTPLKKWYDLTEEQEESGLFTPPDCLVRWESGAAAEVNVVVSLDKYPRNVYIVEERPSAYAGEAADIEFGEKYIAFRQQQIQEAATAIVGVVSAVHQATSSSPSTMSFGMDGPYDMPYFHSVQGVNGSSWNWVSAGSRPVGLTNLGAGNGRERAGMVPVVPAASCKGAIVMGECSGSVINPGVQSFCAGSFVNGRCLGSVIFAR